MAAAEHTPAARLLTLAEGGDNVMFCGGVWLAGAAALPIFPPRGIRQAAFPDLRQVQE